jgi:amino acid permease
MLAQISAKEKSQNPIHSYSDLGKYTLGWFGKLIVDGFMITGQMGVTTGYLLVFGHQMDQVVCYESLFEYCGYKNYFMALAAFIIIPVCWLKSFFFVGYISLASNFCLLSASKLNWSQL